MQIHAGNVLVVIHGIPSKHPENVRIAQEHGNIRNARNPVSREVVALGPNISIGIEI
jgi:hypothetical protein